MAESLESQRSDLASTAREHGEATMESFIKHQMMIILQPFVNHIQDVDTQISNVADRVNSTDMKVLGHDKSIGELKAEIVELRSDLKKTDSQIASAHAGVQSCVNREELIQQGMESANGFAQRLHDKLADIDAHVSELQRNLGEQECDNQFLKANVQRTNDLLSNEIKCTLERLGSGLKDLHGSHAGSAAEVDKLRKDHDHHASLLVGTRQVVDQGRLHSAGLQKAIEELREMEAQLSSRLEGWKNQWSKLHPGIESLRKDNARLKQQCEQHESAIFTLQKGNHTSFELVEKLQNRCEKLGGDMSQLGYGLADNCEGLSKVQEQLAKTHDVVEATQSRLQRAESDAQKASTRMDSLDAKHSSVSSSLDKTNTDVSELACDHKVARGTLQCLQHELQKANDTLSIARGHIDGTQAGLQGFKTELARTNEAIKKLDQGVEMCRAGFSGLQRGFVETGSHVANQRLTLPRLPMTSPKGVSSPRDKAVAVSAAANLSSGTLQSASGLDSFGCESARYSSGRTCSTTASSCYGE
eukprot:TRINITY_DN61382_c0_g1_i1.p1 TRINITY_DN61382_c0_g1~~TRINITY_DN61382_c0_g1_i1.p1  ORF type:complete len:529 (+),score=83.72 TRINITY_DN61382_c0_g1_i1:94-1680(+)